MKVPLSPLVAMRKKPTKYMTRGQAAAFVSTLGIPTTYQSLSHRASRSLRPRFAHINGRTFYTAQWLLDWIEEELSKPFVKRFRRSRSK